MILLPCPWCGDREVSEFGYAGELVPRPDPGSATARQWRDYLYLRDNRRGLAAAGERVFSRSFKYHRPRGVLTASYTDPGCTVQVGDEPNVRGAHCLVTEGMDVRAQNCW